MIVLDASVLIAYLDAEDVHHAAAEALLARAAVEEDDVAANPLTLAEVLVAPVRKGRLDVTLAALRELEVHELAFPVDVAARLAGLRAETRLKMPDCCVLLTAEDEGRSVATFDERLAESAGRRQVPVFGP